ncbi:dehydrogenase/reductase SDR family member 7-like isoform X2 [Orbicella faveolata]|uniref:dehydrogenase/reductase SDR family member 7-like isoform X2 n=1 Tax=Orbicella faveolata TaxID=48498 RepID=UPI0009E33413|nr:dehydrogenase/reductase SDR family member 7-like isoform X2 [Orbicella faveolata]
MRWNFLIAAVLVPVICFLLFKFQDGDFTLMIYEMIGQDPAVALRGKVVWITGASSGIGEYLAYELVKYGCKLVLSARRKVELERVKKNCAVIAIAHDSSFKTDQDILVLPLDLLKYDTHEKRIQDVLNHFEKVDILVNNAGRSQRAWLEKSSLEVDRALLDLNVVGTISLTKAVLPHMIERHEGQIVVVSSILGKIGFPFKATLSASKHALQGYFDTARLELAEHNIHVQTVLPGPELKDAQNLPQLGMMSTERCAHLMAVGVANNLDEVWITETPPLLMLYSNQYLPNLYRWLSKKFLMERIGRLYTDKKSLSRPKSHRLAEQS